MISDGLPTIVLLFNDWTTILMVPSFLLLLDAVSTPDDEVEKTPLSSPDVTHSQGSKNVHFVDQLKEFTEGIYTVNRVGVRERSQKYPSLFNSSLLNMLINLWIPVFDSFPLYSVFSCRRGLPRCIGICSCSCRGSVVSNYSCHHSCSVDI